LDGFWWYSGVFLVFFETVLVDLVTGYKFGDDAGSLAVSVRRDIG